MFCLSPRQTSGYWDTFDEGTDFYFPPGYLTLDMHDYRVDYRAGTICRSQQIHFFIIKLVLPGYF